jgi:hypothetical protein
MPEHDEDIPLSHKFLDKEGTEWVLELDVGLIEDIKEQTLIDFDLLLTQPDRLASVFLSEPKKLVEILWVMCEKQATDKKLDPRAFGRRFDRPTLDRAANAIIVAVVNFYPRSSAGRVIAEKLPGLIAKMDRELSEKTRLTISEEKAVSNTPMS